MSFPAPITSVLTGAPMHVLERWRESGLVVPENLDQNPTTYSFRDLVAIRTMVRLRSEETIERVRADLSDLTDAELAIKPEHVRVLSLAEVYEPFENEYGQPVIGFRRPRPNLRVDPRVLGGWPTINDTLIGYDTIADLVAGGDVTYSRVAHFYPGVTIAAVTDAVDFASQVADRQRPQSEPNRSRT